jgi:hypothetical protein
LELAYRNFGALDLPRRGLAPRSAPLAVLLVDIEADLVIADGDRVVWSERLFPVAELAHALALWLLLPGDERESFEFVSMSYEEVGAVRIADSDAGWRVGSVFEADAWTAPVAWPLLVQGLWDFVDRVRRDVAAIGVRPDFIPKA